MSLPRLLQLATGRVPLYVTVDGQLVRDAVAPSGRQNVRVEPHTNHGGTIPHPADAARPWWIEDPHRLWSEATRMRDMFPGFALTAPNGRPTWIGSVDTGRGRFTIIIEHRSDLADLPRVEVLRPTRLERKEGRRYRRSEHLFDDDSVCYADDSDWRPDVGHDATTVVAWAACWLASYTHWRMTGWWPYRSNAA